MPDNRLLWRLITASFFYDIPSIPFVHKNLFLEDMAAERTYFCSSRLINTMLASACVCLVKWPYLVQELTTGYISSKLVFTFLAGQKSGFQTASRINH